MVNIDTLKHCLNLLKNSNEIKQYIKKMDLLNLINDIEQVFLMGTAIK